MKGCGVTIADRLITPETYCLEIGRQLLACILMLKELSMCRFERLEILHPYWIVFYKLELR